MRSYLLLISSLFFLACSQDYQEERLERLIDHYDLRPLAVRQFETDPKYELGRALFFDNALSGNRDTSCATCHLWNRGSSDALIVSIGTNAMGLGENRRLNNDMEPVHPRNSLDLWNRDNNAVRALFWDGRVEMIDPERRIFKTPLEDALPQGLDNTLAVQALFPLIRSDEMLGYYGDASSSDLPSIHAALPNELVTQAGFNSEFERAASAFEQIITRIIGGANKESWQEEYLALFRSAYPQVNDEQFSVVHIANALSHFEELAFATRSTPWDEFLSGVDSAISDNAKFGAVLFYGKGRCASCHSGPLMSDFNYHAIGIPDFGPGMDGNGRDYGRFNATGIEEDRYKFRTPPLRNVAESSPYFHNGIISGLEDAIRHHNQVTVYSDQYNEDGSFMMRRDQLEAISPLLINGLNLNDQEITYLAEFLRSLTSELDPEIFAEIIPKEVPSGLPIHRLNEPTRYLSE